MGKATIVFHGIVNQHGRMGAISIHFIAGRTISILEFPSFDCEIDKGFDVNMHHHMQNSTLYWFLTDFLRWRRGDVLLEDTIQDTRTAL